MQRARATSRLLLAACAGALLAAAGGAGGDERWQRHGERDGVTVELARVPGSDVPVVRASAAIAAPTGRVWEALSGPALRFDGLKVRRSLGACGAGCEYVYFRMGNWMITDRHYVIRMEWRTERRGDGTAYLGAWRLAPERPPRGDGAVGIRATSGSWRLEPAAGGAGTRAVYTNHLDLGGSVPASLYSLGFVRNAYDVVAKVRRWAERGTLEE